MTTAECWELVASSTDGHLALHEPVGVFPMIIPVHYLRLGHAAVIEIGPGLLLDSDLLDPGLLGWAASCEAPAALAVDGCRSGGARWGVVLQGRVEPLRPADIRRWRPDQLLASGVRTWSVRLIGHKIRGALLGQPTAPCDGAVLAQAAMPYDTSEFDGR